MMISYISFIKQKVRFWSFTNNYINDVTSGNGIYCKFILSDVAFLINYVSERKGKHRQV